ncbi:hypothetical protein MSAN_00119800 [Mycena sanguinolenta]|uniref:Uncharacterized protein n=1 Tax=Mycena sanguinolenta TaxID=230812 RepID=A0A8H6ZDL6_9AGAR|nr:hypothetical protein MSAN_00119800 [Mycena sanguinolenta]
MDDQPNLDADYTRSSTSETESPSAHARPASGMFSHSQHFTMTGGTFTNVTNHTTAPSLPPDFRMISMANIDLRHQIRVDDLRADEWDVWNAQHRERACVRRVHSAKAIIGRRRWRVTVAMYEGNDAEQEWRNDLAKYMRLRQVSRTFPPQAISSLTHPAIRISFRSAAPQVQTEYTLRFFNDGTAVSVHPIPMALTFEIDLILLQEVLDRHGGSLFSTVYIYAHCNQDFRVRNAGPNVPALTLLQEVYNYIYSAFQRALWSSQCTPWIRHSTGRLCIELTPASDILWLDGQPPKAPALPRLPSLSANAETITAFIDSLTLEQYHRMCYWNLAQNQHFVLFASTTVNLGTVFRCSSDPLENSIEIASLPISAPVLGDWMTFEGRTGGVTFNGWTRFQSGDVFNRTLSILVYLPWKSNPEAWLSQANHIFRRLNITSNFEDYVLLHNIQFQLDIPETAGDPPEGFLFLCPKEDFRTGSSSFCWPACPAYSLRSGAM